MVKQITYFERSFIHHHPSAHPISAIKAMITKSINPNPNAIPKTEATCANVLEGRLCHASNPKGADIKAARRAGTAMPTAIRKKAPNPVQKDK